MNSAVKYIISKLKECDDYHNRCDYLLDHSEITYLLDYIKYLERKEEVGEQTIRALAVNQSLLNMVLMKLGFTQQEVLDMTEKAYDVYDKKRKEENDEKE